MVQSLFAGFQQFFTPTIVNIGIDLFNPVQLGYTLFPKKTPSYDPDLFGSAATRGGALALHDDLQY